MKDDVNALAIHTASADLGLALTQASDRRQRVWDDLARATASHLHLHLAEFVQPLQWAELAWIAVAKGPGGFTGTRLGLVTARTLAQQLDIPLFGISTLAAAAWCHRLEAQQRGCPTIAIQMPAHRGELYGALYGLDPDDQTPQLHPLYPDAVLSPDRWQQRLATQSSPYHLVQLEGGLGYTTPALLELALGQWHRGDRPHWSTVLPFYGQSPV